MDRLGKRDIPTKVEKKDGRTLVQHSKAPETWHTTSMTKNQTSVQCQAREGVKLNIRACTT
eukprot:387924-Amphidinium_carterae.1